MKQSADDNFEFDENVRKFSKRVENTVSKGEIARYEQFLLFPQCFQKACFPGASKGVIVLEWVKTQLYQSACERLNLLDNFAIALQEFEYTNFLQRVFQKKSQHVHKIY